MRSLKENKDLDTNLGDSNQSIKLPSIVLMNDERLYLDHSEILDDNNLVRSSKYHNHLIFVRNSEHMNKPFPNWLTANFDGNKYNLKDMNQPAVLPIRNSAVQNFGMDPPLTVMGTRMASILSRELYNNGVHFTAVYSSPTLRCIETATRLIQPHSKLLIRVEPAFFNFQRENNKKKTIFMTPEELKLNNYPIDENYTPIMTFEMLNKVLGTETPDNFAVRSFDAIRRVIHSNSTSIPFGVILIVTQASNMHTIARNISGKSLAGTRIPKITFNEILSANENYPYCAMMAFTPTLVEEKTNELVAGSIHDKEKKYYKMEDQNMTGDLTHARWSLQSGILPSFQTTFFNNRFNASFFNNPVKEAILSKK